MDGVNVDEIDYRNHKFKCRICFKSFNAREQQVEITRTLELKFLDVTQTNVNKSRKFHFKNWIQYSRLILAKNIERILKQTLWNLQSSTPQPLGLPSKCRWSPIETLRICIGRRKYFNQNRKRDDGSWRRIFCLPNDGMWIRRSKRFQSDERTKSNKWTMATTRRDRFRNSNG